MEGFLRYDFEELILGGAYFQNFTVCCEKLGTSHDDKCFAIGSFLERIVVERAKDDLCQKNIKTAGLTAQNRSIPSEIYPEYNHKICRFFTDCFQAKFDPKIPAKSADFSAILSLKIPRTLTFFSATYQKPSLSKQS